MQESEVAIQSSRHVLQTPWMSVREDMIVNGSKKEPFYIIEQPDCVTIVATDSRGDIAMVQPYRYYTKAANWELPSGYIEPGEQPLEAAKRELLEETGLTAGTWQSCGWMYAKNDRSTARIFVFAARELELPAGNHHQEDDIVATSSVSIEEIQSMIREGRIVDSDTIAAFSLAWLQLTIKENTR